MTRLGLFVLVASTLLLQACPSAYQATYDRETQRLEQQAAAQHAAASRYAAVVYFDVGSDVVGDDGRRELGWFVQQVQPYPRVVILVQGFADTTGSEAKNQGLSEARAQAVASVLASQGIERSRLNVQGIGTASAAASNETPKGRSRNRRVEVTVQ